MLFSPSAPGGFVVTSHAGDNDLAAKDYVRARLGIAPGMTLKPAQLAPARREQDAPGEQDPSPDGTACALRIWREAEPAAGSPVEAYLARRGLSLPNVAHEVIRYASACPFAGTRTPAMVALVRSVSTDTPQAIHRTALTRDGRKAVVNGRDRLALGGLRGGAVKLTADAEVTYCLGIGEGIESTLSLRHLPEFGNSPVWALLNTAGVAGFMPLSAIESLWLAVDHDPGGEKAARACAGRWRFAGKETFLITPDAPGTDCNDLLTEALDG
ncbi:DUF7146 domain-containing protein [Methylobacterium phyllosphaerae]